MMFSIKMRSSKGGPHEKGGRHISGIERIVNEDEVESEIINASYLTATDMTKTGSGRRRKSEAFSIFAPPPTACLICLIKRI